MKMRLPAVSIAALGLFASLPAFAADYHALKEIPIGGQGGFDYLLADAANHRLYVSHGASAVVIDTDTDTIIGSVSNTPGIHGIALVPELGLGFTSNGREAKASAFDLKTLETKAKIDTGANPDAILFEPGQQEIYTFNGRGNSVTVIDPKKLAVVTTISLGDGKPESAVADVKAGRVYDNLENKNEIAVIDTKSHAVVAHWPIAPAGGASGMAFDADNHLIFIGCSEPPVMEMIDASTGKVVGSVPIGTGVDANAFDPATKLAFASCGDGTTTIAHEDAPDKLTVVQKLTTQRGARTMTLDTKTHKIYMAVGQGESFKVLSYGM